MKRQNEKSYFEDWYIKLLDAKHQTMMRFSIRLDRIGEKNKGMLQILCDMGESREEIQIPIEHGISNKEELKVADNTFSEKSISLNIEENKFKLKGQLEIGEIVDLKQSFLKPGLMGYYKYLPLMEFYQEVFALQGRITGTLQLNGEEIDLSGGQYYIQKQWGSKFPNVWLWAQGNGFEKKKDLAVSVGIARLKVLFNYYTAFAIPVYYNGELEVFSNYNGGQIAKLYRYKGYTHLIVTQKDKILDLKIYGRDEIECISGKETHGIRDIYECNRVKMEVKITENGSVILEDVSTECNIEMGGNTSKLK